MGKRTDEDQYRAQGRGGKGIQAMNLTEKTGDLACCKMTSGEEDMMLVRDDGTIIRTPVSQVPNIGRATHPGRPCHAGRRGDPGGMCGPGASRGGGGRGRPRPRTPGIGKNKCGRIVYRLLILLPRHWKRVPPYAMIHRTIIQETRKGYEA